MQRITGFTNRWNNVNTRNKMIISSTERSCLPRFYNLQYAEQIPTIDVQVRCVSASRSAETVPYKHYSLLYCWK